MAEQKPTKKAAPKAAADQEPADQPNLVANAEVADRAKSREADKLQTIPAARSLGRRSLGGATEQHTHDRPDTARDPVVWSDKTVQEGRSVPVETLANPALAGAPEVEIATRTADRTQAEDTRFRKRYVVLAEAYQPETDTIHARNKVATLNEAINRGLHPQEEATFDGVEPHPDGVSVYLDYSVEVVPAIVDGDAPSAVTPLKVLHDVYDGTTESGAARRAEGVRGE